VEGVAAGTDAGRGVDGVRYVRKVSDEVVRERAGLARCVRARVSLPRGGVERPRA
jgi:hypothetical protein